jgi:2-phosphoglycerate kinase
MASRKPRILVVYGVPCTGKSTGAVAYAAHHGLRTVLHTDYLREVQRGHIGQHDLPVLWTSTHSAWALRGEPTRENILDGFTDHVDSVMPAIRRAMMRVLADGFDAVIEGAHFYGKTIDALRFEFTDAVIDEVLLTVRDREDLRLHIARKDAARASVAEGKDWMAGVDVILTIQDFLISGARARNGVTATEAEWRQSWAATSHASATSITS